ncbi:MAG: RCC1 domain-containing protein [Sandaracinaceae bacterium]
MNRHRFVTFASLLLAASLFGACGDNSDSDAGLDGEVEADTGTPPSEDSGPEPDSGPMVDAGPPIGDCTTDCEYVEINVGALHVCGRRENGEVLCWGRNQESQLGDNRTRHDNCTVPGNPPEDCTGTPENTRFLSAGGMRPRIEDAVSLAVDGFTSSCAIREGGELWCWSNETVPETAGGVQEQRATAEQETKFSDVRSAAASGSHLCVTTGSEGAVRCFGNNGRGQLGVGFIDELIIDPVDVLVADFGAMPVLDGGLPMPDGGTDGGMADAGTDAGTDAGVADAGVVDAGVADAGVADAGMDAGLDAGIDAGTDAGMMADAGFPSMPLVGGLEVSLGGSFTCARTADDVFCWGANRDDQLGDGRTTTHRTCVESETDRFDCSPFAVVVGGTGEARLGAVQDIDVGSSHACAVRDGAVYCWGDNRSGESGQPAAFETAGIPSQVGDFTDAIQVAAASAHSCALHNDGTISCWGSNLEFQLGDGLETHGETCSSGATTADCSRNPVDVSVIDDATYIAANSATTCAIREDGSVWCWGFNTNRQLGDGTRENRSMPVMVMGTP